MTSGKEIFRDIREIFLLWNPEKWTEQKILPRVISVLLYFLNLPISLCRKLVPGGHLSHLSSASWAQSPGHLLQLSSLAACFLINKVSFTPKQYYITTAKFSRHLLWKCWKSFEWLPGVESWTSVPERLLVRGVMGLAVEVTLYQDAFTHFDKANLHQHSFSH